MIREKVAQNFMEHFSTEGENRFAQLLTGTICLVYGGNTMAEYSDVADKAFYAGVAAVGALVMYQSLDKLISPRFSPWLEKRYSASAQEQVDGSDTPRSTEN